MSAAGRRVRHTVPSVSRRQQNRLRDICLLLEGGSDTQCHRFHGDSRTVLGIYVCCWREGQTHSAIGLTATRGESCAHQYAAGGRVRHTVQSVSLRQQNRIRDICLLLEEGSDTNSKHWFTTSFLQEAAGKRRSECGSNTQCHRFYGDPRTVLWTYYVSMSS